MVGDQFDNKAGRGRPFPFEDRVRQRYHVFRARRHHGFSSLLDLVALLVVLGLGILVLTFVFFALFFVLCVAPFFILGGMVLRWLAPRQAKRFEPDNDRDANVTIIDVEVDRP